MNSDLTSFDKIEQKIGGSRKISNYIIGGMLTIGGIGFLLASISSYTGRDLLPLGNPSTLLFIPQGIIMGAYGVIANLLNFYLWYLVYINFGSGSNYFDKSSKSIELTFWPKIRLTPVLRNELSNASLKDCIDFLRCHRPCGS